ncbi:MAG: hypothetical protein WAL36_10675 [Pseudolabrys sp.]|jgi:hypothetical protein
MSKIKLQYVQEYIDRHGKVRRYFRRPNCKRIFLPGSPGSDEFMAVYQAALGSQPSLDIGAGRSKQAIRGLMLFAIRENYVRTILQPAF